MQVAVIKQAVNAVKDNGELDFFAIIGKGFPKDREISGRLFFIDSENLTGYECHGFHYSKAIVTFASQYVEDELYVVLRKKILHLWDYLEPKKQCVWGKVVQRLFFSNLLEEKGTKLVRWDMNQNCVGVET